MYRLFTLLILTSLLVSCTKRNVKVNCCGADPFFTVFSGGQALVPNVFTPNGDGVNDTFGPILEGVVSYDMTIVNTKDKVLYSTSSSGRWDGKVDGAVFSGIVGWKIELRTDDVEIINITGQVCSFEDTDGTCPNSADNCTFENQATSSGTFDNSLPSNEAICTD